MKDDLPPLIDSHCHLTESALSTNVDGCLERARAAGVHFIVSVGVEPDTSRETINQAESYPDVYATVGLHPHEASGFSDRVVKNLRGMAEHPRVVAIGETGLDYHYEFSPKEQQKEAFAAQVVLAREMGLPLVVHSREAVEDCIEIIGRYGEGTVCGVFHCFGGPASMISEILELGFYLSFAGNITFKGFDGTCLEQIPFDRLLVETDAPYLAPIPYRGKTNEPAYLPSVLKGFTRFIGNVPLEKLAAHTTTNAVSLFGIGEGVGRDTLDLLDEYID